MIDSTSCHDFFEASFAWAMRISSRILAASFFGLVGLEGFGVKKGFGWILYALMLVLPPILQRIRTIWMAGLLFFEQHILVVARMIRQRRMFSMWYSFGCSVKLLLMRHPHTFCNDMQVAPPGSSRCLTPANT